MAHEVWAARIDTKVVAHKDLEITIKSNGEKIGKLLISKGNIEMAAEGSPRQQAPFVVVEARGSDGARRQASKGQAMTLKEWAGGNRS